MTYRHITGLSLLLFLLSLAGLSESVLGSLMLIDEQAANTLWSYNRGSVGLLYTGGTNRFDFLLFTLLPVITNEIWKATTKSRATDDVLLTFYCCLMFPFFAFAFVPYSDRLAFYAWLIWPVLLCDRALAMNGWESRAFLFFWVGTIGTVALFKLYGLTATELAIAYLL
jgi:hypothetical protein